MFIFIRLICYIKDRVEQKELFKEIVVGKGYFLRELEVLELLFFVFQYILFLRVQRYSWGIEYFAIINFSLLVVFSEFGIIGNVFGFLSFKGNYSFFMWFMLGVQKQKYLVRLI